MLPRSAPRAVAALLVPRPLTRFVPGVFGGFALIALPLVAAVTLSAPTLSAGLAGFALHAAGWTVALGAGFLLALRRLAPTLRHDAEISGRRSITAGAAAAGALLSTAMLLGAVPEWVRLFAAAGCGAVVGTALFWPWRLSRAEREALRALDAA